MNEFIAKEEARLADIVDKIRAYEIDRREKIATHAAELARLKNERLNEQAWQRKNDLTMKIRDKEHHAPAKYLPEFTEAHEPYSSFFSLNDHQFGRQEFLLGNQSLFDSQQQILIVNWRLPIAAMYYEYEVGDDYDEEIAGKDREGVITGKIQYTIHQQTLKRISCQQTGTFEKVNDAWVDQLVQGAPSPSAGKEITGNHQLPDIVALIDKNQYGMIRQDCKGITMISGPAGSGKTTTMLYKLSWALFNHQNQFSPANCLVIVFNRSLKDYLKSTITKQIDARVKVETFHAWALQACRQCGLKLQFSTKVPVAFDQLKRAAFMAEAINEFGLQEHQGLSLLEALYTIYADQQLLKRHAGNDSRKISEIEKLAQFYRGKIKDQVKLISFSDAGPIIRLLQISQARRNPKASSPVLNTLDFACIDEGQDLSRTETLAIMHACKSEPRCMIICADRNQHILESVEAAHIELSVQGQQSLNSLTMSYRCTDQINAIANQIIDQQTGSLSGRQGEPVTFSRPDSYEQAVQELREIIVKERTEHPGALLAVVTKYKKEVERLYERCQDLDGTRLETTAFTYQPGCIFVHPEVIKGIEYSAVVFFNPSAKSFPAKTINRNTVYMVVTRGCDRLYVLCHDQPTVYLQPFFASPAEDA